MAEPGNGSKSVDFLLFTVLQYCVRLVRSFRPWKMFAPVRLQTISGFPPILWDPPPHCFSCPSLSLFPVLNTRKIENLHSRTIVHSSPGVCSAPLPGKTFELKSWTYVCLPLSAKCTCLTDVRGLHLTLTSGGGATHRAFLGVPFLLVWAPWILTLLSIWGQAQLLSSEKCVYVYGLVSHWISRSSRTSRNPFMDHPRDPQVSD